MSDFDDTIEPPGDLTWLEQAITPRLEIFSARFPEIANAETRVVTILEGNAILPSGEFGFTEFYCIAPKCDCRTVQLRVCSERRPPDRAWAGISFGWETEAFYRKWLPGSKVQAREVTEAYLEPLSPQSRYAEGFLKLFRTRLMTDQDYVDRLARHYRIVKESLKKHSGLRLLGRPGGGRRKRRS